MFPSAPDPYKALGVSKDATLPEIRSAHRKLILKCHPDKVQDAKLKAIKQDEFQKVQQAYELLSDDAKRLQYDEECKLFELRKEMGRGNPTARSNPFEYQDKTPDSRPSSYGRPPPHSVPVYSYGPIPRSHEDVMYEDSRHQPRKSTSYESTTDRNRTAERDTRGAENIRRREEMMDEEDRQRRAREKEIKRGHSEKKKTRDKEKRKGTEEKRSRTSGPFVEDDSEDNYSPRSADKKSNYYNKEDDFRKAEDAAYYRVEEVRKAEEARRAAEAARAEAKKAAMDPKWNEHMDFAGKYMQAARRKGAAEETPFPNPGMRRSETYAAPTSREFKIHYNSPNVYSEDDSPRRSSAPRRASETPSTRKEGERSRSRRSPSHSRESPVIVESSSPPRTSPLRKPTLQTQSSAPPNLSRDKPSRSKTQDYPRNAVIPPLARAQTFQTGDRGQDRDHRSSGLKKEVSPSDSESEDHPRRSPRHSSSPPRQSETRYAVDGNRAVPVPPATTRHRAEMHSLNENYSHDESPRGTPSKPQLARSPPSSDTRPRTATNRSTSYYTAPEAPPIIVTARPKLSRDTSSSRGSAVKYDNVQYAPAYTTDQVKFANRPGPDSYDRRTRDHDYYPSSHGRSGVYASG